MGNCSPTQIANSITTIQSFQAPICHQIPKTRLLTPLPPQLRKRRQRRQRKPERLLLNLRPKRERLLKKRKKRRKQKNKVSQILSSTSIHKSTNQIQKMVFLLYTNNIILLKKRKYFISF